MAGRTGTRVHLFDRIDALDAAPDLATYRARLKLILYDMAYMCLQSSAATDETHEEWHDQFNSELRGETHSEMSARGAPPIPGFMMAAPMSPPPQAAPPKKTSSRKSSGRSESRRGEVETPRRAAPLAHSAHSNVPESLLRLMNEPIGDETLSTRPGAADLSLRNARFGGMEGMGGSFGA